WGGSRVDRKSSRFAVRVPTTKGSPVHAPESARSSSVPRSAGLLVRSRAHSSATLPDRWWLASSRSSAVVFQRRNGKNSGSSCSSN
ncbi:MAG: hypothetical protein AVDCRST_MAG59-4789, partial [uncultured Thermomicrobiales bacterium]